MGMQNQGVLYLVQQDTTSRKSWMQQNCIFRDSKRPVNKVSDLLTMFRDMLQPFPLSYLSDTTT
ncbi:hypothetical protein ACRRTK_014582 [Alexandromys fortis]